MKILGCKSFVYFYFERLLLVALGFFIGVLFITLTLVSLGCVIDN
jgi:hypothetical protein